MIRCVLCGAALAPADRFCPHCGNDVRTLLSSVAVAAPVADRQAPVELRASPGASCRRHGYAREQSGE